MDDVARALQQVAEIREQMAKGEIYRGYRSVPVALSGVIGLLAAWLQPHLVGTREPVAFVLYWVGVAACAVAVGASEIVFNYVVHEQPSTRRRTRLVIGQFLPAVLAAAVITASFVHLDRGLVPILPGLWAVCFGLGTFASSPYLPKASAWVASFYCAAGTGLLWAADTSTPGPWWVGGVFGVGQLLAALVLYTSLERERSL